jgi:hypothetical protein
MKGLVLVLRGHLTRLISQGWLLAFVVGLGVGYAVSLAVSRSSNNGRFEARYLDNGAAMWLLDRSTGRVCFYDGSRAACDTPHVTGQRVR